MRTFLVVVLAVIVLGLSEIDAASEDVCGCEAVEIVTTTDVVLRKHGQLLGRYHFGSTILLSCCLKKACSRFTT